MTSSVDRAQESSPTMAPRRKVLAGGFAGSFVTLVVTILNTYVIKDPASKITPELATLATTVLSTLVAYLTPPDPGETTIIGENGEAKAAKLNSPN